MNSELPASNNEQSGLASPGMRSLLAAQFLSALADNLLFVVAIALLKQAADGAALMPVLQVMFVIAFVVLAPFVGALADAFPKGRVMFYANLVKLVGAVVVLYGAHPLFGYALAGVGAAIYSPAKYGILPQLVRPQQLVKANGWLEGSTIVAILLGVVLGGFLADHSLALAGGVAAALYALAAGINLWIPRLAIVHRLHRQEIPRLVMAFFRDIVRLWRHPDVRFSVIGTSLFWGMGSSLRLLLFVWVPAALLLNDNQTPANLMGVLSIGIVAGATLAGLWVSLDRVNRALWGGVLLGPLVLLLAPMHSLSAAALVLFGIGLAGGLFVVPLNALLQERGAETVGAGRILAVQNFFENLSMLVMSGLYFWAVEAGIKPIPLALLFGGGILLGMLALAWWRRGHRGMAVG
ncbi:lysophospholipid transporter LplT [Halothiobacillus sp. DCM-1]|uniref:lysophospholipid transporter LplT n=1 Tax=Halothiobacillus sp. DCM-1 TaxID=3112558 RepID=UPI003251C2BF